MELKPVQSSQIAALGYDAGTQTLAVRFHPTAAQKKEGKPGSTYAYRNVAPGDATRLREAESIGSHFIKFIKADPKSFPFTKLD